MRILANYGYKNNGDTYSVTFETVGDVPKEQADATVDELFRMAKAAIERQLNPAFSAAQRSLDVGKGEANTEVDHSEFPPEEEEGAAPAAQHENNSRPKIKDPDAPATKKQKRFIARLAKERGQFIEGLNDLTMQEASHTIDELMAVAA